ncbi:MAG: ribosome silencing factor [Gammaproteobacteria bacterium]
MTTNEDTVKICVSALADLKAQNIQSLNISKTSNFADWLIVATATSNTHARAVSDKVIEAIKENNLCIIGVEGKEKAEWVLIDGGDVVINIMLSETREFYDLEGLWGAYS